jgi:hypothetical protein
MASEELAARILARTLARLARVEQRQGKVSARILARLDELERNQAWLARKVGVDLSVLYRWLTNEHLIPERRLARIAEVLELDVDELRELATEPEPEGAAA